MTEVMNTPTGQEPMPTDPEPEGQPEPEQPKVETLTAEALRAALDEVRAENKAWRRKFREIEAQLAEAKRAEAEAAERQAAEQGRFQELYEAEKKARGDLEAQLRRLEYDAQRKDAAQVAGIPHLWARLQGDTPDALADDAQALAAMMAPIVPPRMATTPTPTPQGKKGLTDDERRARAGRTF